MTKEERKEYMKEYRKTYKEDIEKKQERNLRYREKNKEKTKEYNKQYNRNNRHIIADCRNRRRARKMKAMSKNIDDTDRNIIRNLYKISQGLSRVNGISYHIDHRKPLSKGGVHHWMNLQIITAEENLRKSNTY